MANSSELIAKVTQLRANPTAIQRLMLRTLEFETQGGVVIVDPTNPFVFLLEAACTMASAGMLQAEALTQQQYASMAQTDSALYTHMSDVDYLNRFATPASTSITLMMSVDEVRSRAVEIPESGGVRQLIIPRHTEITVAGTPFTLQHPIHIRVMPHDALSVTYDVDVSTPMYRLTTNQLEWSLMYLEQTQYLRIVVPIRQMRILSQMAQLNAITGFSKDYTFTDKFYYCRAFTKATLGATWTELRTTHSDQVYDPTVPTVVLKVTGQTLNIYIPQVYFNNGLIRDSLRIDIYSTLGELEMELGNYASTSYTANWNDYDAVVDSVYTAPIFIFSGLGIYSDSVVTGGSNNTSFDKLRTQVIDNALVGLDTPITHGQLATSATSSGFDIVTSIDNVTDRQFLATRTLPPPTNGSTITGAGCIMQTVQTKLSELALSQAVKNNGDRLTILPSALFQNTGVGVKLVPDSVVSTLLNPLLTPPDTLAGLVNDNEYYYTPFYYVLDAAGSQYHTRAYRLDNPSVTEKYFVDDNPTLGIAVATRNYEFAVNPSGAGYILAIEVGETESFLAYPPSQYVLQLSYLPAGATTRIYLQGTLVSELDEDTGYPLDDLYVYHFYLDTHYDVDPQHRLILEPYRIPLPLETTFDLVYAITPTNDYPFVSGAVGSSMDAIIDTSIAVDDAVYYAISQESLVLRFGVHLEHLWSRSRTTISAPTYLTYTADVPAVYTTPVDARDATGNLLLNYVAQTDTYNITRLHDVGDPVLSPAGASVWATVHANDPLLTVTQWWATLIPTLQAAYGVLAHRAGDRVLDADGVPILADDTRQLLRQFDLLLIDGKYYFATDDATVSYRSELVDMLESWITTSVVSIATRLLERSELFFYPKSTIGTLEVYAGAGQLVSINAAQSFVVEYYMSSERYDNSAVRDAIQLTTARVLSQSLDATRIAVSDIVAALRTALGDDVLSVHVTGFVDDLYPAITLKDQSMRPSIGKQLVSLSNLTLAVQDAIAITYVRHS